MKHIKTPTRVGYDDERKVVVLYDADGEYVISRFGGERCADQFREISAAVNVHDALAEALEASMALSQHLAACDSFDVPDGDCATCLELGQKMRELRRAALAKVRGEAE